MTVNSNRLLTCVVFCTSHCLEMNASRVLRSSSVHRSAWVVEGEVCGCADSVFVPATETKCATAAAAILRDSARLVDGWYVNHGRRDMTFNEECNGWRVKTGTKVRDDGGLLRPRRETV